MHALNFQIIGHIESCFTSKFGIPRQANLVPQLRARLILRPEFSGDSVRGLADFSHVWVMFYFHVTAAQGWKKLIHPPKLGGKTKVGVFASRSNFRPNPIGLSAVKLEGIENQGANTILHLSGGDFLDQTPVLDVRPYLPYADAIMNADNAWAQTSEKTPNHPIIWLEDAATSLKTQENTAKIAEHRALIEALLRQDPRPGFHHSPTRAYHMVLTFAEIRWRVQENHIEIFEYRAR